ncbi:FAD:protein FMN transferase [Actinomyces slackii]|uniref:FAD:protein FMN transferase n=1 Tax=Actinomyces slackii TaxID=52774 RepID=A0A448KDA5_9ACTO|nr:FAD:protein FMN transferase [Actinomyces slackii]VEG74870.1 Thiamine biosynthesis lipoprotein ApbE precursor [Actinomyces slackii]
MAAFRPQDALASSTWSFPATGTTWRVSTAAPLAPALREEITALVEAFEQTWSRFRPSSLVSRAARGEMGPGPISLGLPAGSAAMLDLYDVFHRLTEGRVDPLVGNDLVELGYDPLLSFTVRDGAPERLGAVRGRPTWAQAVEHEGDALTLREPALIDIGAVGKGFLADLIGQTLEAAGAGDYLIDGSGDLLVHCARPVRIGLEQPGRPGFVVGAVEISRGAVCGSGVDRRAWGEGLHHILDAVTGRPVQPVAAAWAMAPTCALADGLATALFTTAPERLASEIAYDFALLRTDGSASTSRTFHRLGELYTS